MPQSVLVTLLAGAKKGKSQLVSKLLTSYGSIFAASSACRNVRVFVATWLHHARSARQASYKVYLSLRSKNVDFIYSLPIRHVSRHDSEHHCLHHLAFLLKVCTAISCTYHVAITGIGSRDTTRHSSCWCAASSQVTDGCLLIGRPPQIAFLHQKSSFQPLTELLAAGRFLPSPAQRQHTRP